MAALLWVLNGMESCNWGWGNGLFPKRHSPYTSAASVILNSATARPAHSYRSGGSGKQFSCASRAAITCLKEPNSNMDKLLWRKPGEGATNWERKKEKWMRTEKRQRTVLEQKNSYGLAAATSKNISKECPLLIGNTGVHFSSWKLKEFWQIQAYRFWEQPKP